MEIKYSSDTMGFVISIRNSKLTLEMIKQPDNIPYNGDEYPDEQWDVGGEGLCFLSRSCVSITNICGSGVERSIFLLGTNPSPRTGTAFCGARDNKFASQLYHGLVALDKYMGEINNT